MYNENENENTKDSVTEKDEMSDVPEEYEEYVFLSEDDVPEEDGEIVGVIKYKPKRKGHGSKWIDKIPTSEIKAFVKTKSTAYKNKRKRKALEKREKNLEKKKNRNVGAIIVYILLGAALAYIILRLIGYKKVSKIEKKQKSLSKPTLDILKYAMPTWTIIRFIAKHARKK